MLVGVSHNFFFKRQTYFYKIKFAVECSLKWLAGYAVVENQDEIKMTIRLQKQLRLRQYKSDLYNSNRYL